MRILITGGSGGLGRVLTDFFRMKGHEVCSLSSSELDVTDLKRTFLAFDKEKPDIVFHCAAIVNADYVESNKEQSYYVNIVGTKNVAECSKIFGSEIVFFSSDYIFSGGDKPHKVDEIPNPVNYYGLTKVVGEQIIKDICQKAYILRISWLFGPYGYTFYQKILSQKDKDEIIVVNDQVGTPTYTLHLARQIDEIIMTHKYGTYNCSNEGYCSWAEYAEEIFKLNNCSTRVKGVNTHEYKCNARRPLNSMLSKEALYEIGVGKLPSWKEALTEFVLSNSGSEL